MLKHRDETVGWISIVSTDCSHTMLTSKYFHVMAVDIPLCFANIVGSY